MKENVKDTMSTDLVSVHSKQKLLEAYHAMQKNRVRHLPVLDDAGKVVGILSDRDINRAMKSKVDCCVQSKCKSEAVEFDSNAVVQDYMSWPIKTFDKDQSLRSVAKEMIREKISSFLIRDGNDIVGIITTEDLLRVLVELLDEPRPGYAWNLDTLLRAPFREAFS